MIANLPWVCYTYDTTNYTKCKLGFVVAIFGRKIGHGNFSTTHCHTKRTFCLVRGIIEEVRNMEAVISPVPIKFTKNPFPVEVTNKSPPKKDGHTQSKRNIDNVRTRLFALVTYATHEQIMYSLSLHEEQVRYSCFILHDKDVKEDGSLKEPHSHIVVETFNAYRVGSVRNWFKNALDEEGEQVTTLGQPVIDRKAVIDYLNHEKRKDKAQYPRDAIVNLVEALLIANEKPRNDDEKALLILDDMIANVPEYVLCRRYGREYIINAPKYRDMIFEIMNDGSLPQVDAHLKRQLHRRFYDPQAYAKLGRKP